MPSAAGVRPGLQMASFSLCPHVTERETELLSPCKATNHLTFMAPKSSLTNTATPAHRVGDAIQSPAGSKSTEPANGGGRCWRGKISSWDLRSCHFVPKQYSLTTIFPISLMCSSYRRYSRDHLKYPEDGVAMRRSPCHLVEGT